MFDLWGNHDEKWKLLPVHELWEHERMFVGKGLSGRVAHPTTSNPRRFLIGCPILAEADRQGGWS